MNLCGRQFVLVRGQLKLVCERDVTDRRVVRIERYAHLLVEEFIKRMLLK